MATRGALLSEEPTLRILTEKGVFFGSSKKNARPRSRLIPGTHKVRSPSTPGESKMSRSFPDTNPIARGLLPCSPQPSHTFTTSMQTIQGMSNEAIKRPLRETAHLHVRGLGCTDSGSGVLDDDAVSRLKAHLLCGQQEHIWLRLTPLHVLPSTSREEVRQLEGIGSEALVWVLPCVPLE